MKAPLFVLRLVNLAILLVLLTLNSACSNSYELVQSEKNSDFVGPPTDKLVVMALYPDENLDLKVVVENEFVQHFKSIGIETSAGYKYFDSYLNIEDRIDEFSEKLEGLGIETVLIIDPVRAIEHDENDYLARNNFYQTFGMKTASFWASIGELAESSDAANFVMAVTLWNRVINDFVWMGTYDINAPGGYNMKAGKEFTKEFAGIVAEHLKTERMIK